MLLFTASIAACVEFEQSSVFEKLAPQQQLQ